ncbi:hypothetical protein L3Q82_020170, partial [Scortum barcoo]
MKSFERLVLAHLKDITGPLLDPLQFAYLGKQTPSTPTLPAYCAAAPTCQWISNFLTNRRQQARLGSITSSTRTISTGAPQGCVLSPLLFSLYTNDCTSGDPNVKLLKFADDTTVIGLIRDGDESAYRREVEQLALWCGHNNLQLNTLKTVEMTDLKWESNIDAIRKKAQQRMYFLRQLRKFNLPQELLIQFYTAMIQSVLCTSITVWFGSATKQERNRLQRTVRAAEKIIADRFGGITK